jgi:predicted transcriptional regulator
MQIQETMEKLSHQEEEAMRCVWQTGEGVVKDFLDKYPAPQPPYTTLASILKNLERKGYIHSRRFGNTWVYTPRVSEEEYKNMSASRLVEHYFDNSYQEMVTFFAKKQKISIKELKDIIKRIEENER